jgi:hypothetical protein
MNIQIICGRVGGECIEAKDGLHSLEALRELSDAECDVLDISEHGGSVSRRCMITVKQMLRFAALTVCVRMLGVIVRSGNDIDIESTHPSFRCTL